MHWSKISLDVNQAVPDHLVDESRARQPDSPPDHPQNGPVVYLAYASTSQTNSPKRLFGLAARKRLSLSLTLSFSSSSYFLSFSKQNSNILISVWHFCKMESLCYRREPADHPAEREKISEGTN